MSGKTLRIIVLVLFLILFAETTVFPAEKVNIPGNSTLLSRYLDFYYNLPSKDFIYHLNDMLIFSEAPTDKMFKKGVREKLSMIIEMEKKIEDLIRTRFQYEKNMFTINISDKKGFRDASKLLNYLGLFLEKKDSGEYAIQEDDSTGIIDYHRFVNLRVKSLEKLVNKTNRLFYDHTSLQMEMPFDFTFLKKCTGLDVNEGNFLELMTLNKDFSLLLGVLFRISEDDIEYISGLEPEGNPWRTIFSDKKFLLGMFNLSSAFRTVKGKLVLPGGEEWGPFWSALAGTEYSNSGLSFLRSIATNDGGKLNYLYCFSFFIQPDSLKPVLFDMDINKMKKIYGLIELEKNEDLSDNRFARLRDPGFFMLMYALETKDGRVVFPGKMRDWLVMLGGKAETEIPDNELYFRIINALMGLKKVNGSESPVSKFITIYSKFINRPGIINEETLNLFYSEHERFNVLTDYIEKINIKDPETVKELYSWVSRTTKMDQDDRAVFTAIYQSLFEILSFSSRFHPNGYDYDALIKELIAIPLDKHTFINELFGFLGKNFHIPLRLQNLDRGFIDFLLFGVSNELISLYNEEYELMNNDFLRESIDKILTSQEVIQLSTVFEFNDLFNRLPVSNQAARNSMYNKTVELFQKLSHPDISEDAPKFIKTRVIAYNRSELNHDLKRLQSLIPSEDSSKEIKELTDKFRAKYLFPHLKNFLVTIAYALNARTEKLRIFINPNLVRLHDFDDSEKNTPWNYTGRPDSSLSMKSIPGFRLKGGLSRLNIIFSSVWRDQMLAGNIIFDMELIESVFTNILNIFPCTKTKYFPEYASLLIEYGVELMENAEDNPEIKEELIRESGRILSGNAYRNVMDYLKGHSEKPLLFYGQYFKFGEALLHYGKRDELFSSKSEIKKYLTLPLKAEIENEKKRFGNIYYRSLGSLKPKWKNFFPPETGNLLQSGAANGEAFREFKLKIAHISEKKKYPAGLQGHFLYNYMISAFSKYYQQNYDKDYQTTYFIFNILNNASLSKTIKSYQRKGYVRLR